MQQIDSLKKSNNISIFSTTLDDQIFSDNRFVQLMNLLLKKDNYSRYSYCFYCDNSTLKTNIFIPVFHTIYMGCRINNVLLKNSEDIWVTNIFRHNKYYVLNEENDDFDYSVHNINKIDSIKEILE